MNLISWLGLLLAITAIAASFLYEPYSAQAYSIGVLFVIAVILFLVGVVIKMEAKTNEESS